MRFKAIIYLLMVNCIFIGCGNGNGKTQDNDIREDIGLSKEDYISDAVDEVVGGYRENVAVYYYKFNGGEEYSLNKDKYFLAASTRKVPQVMEVLDKIQKGELSLDTDIEYDDAVDYEEGTGILQYEEYIEPLSIKEAVELSLIYSDNIADNMLSRLCGDDLNRYIETITEETNIPLGNETTAQQQFKIYDRLYNNPENNINYPMVIEILKKTEFHDRLDKYIPQEITAHKIGNYYRYYHDVGIIDTAEPYILVVLTKDIGDLNVAVPDGDERNLIDWGEGACELIAEISRRIYEIVTTAT